MTEFDWNKPIAEIKQFPLVDVIEHPMIPVPDYYYYQDGNVIYVLEDNETLIDIYEDG